MRVILSKKSVSFSMNKKWRATVRNLLTSRLPPSDLLQQQAQNGSRQRGMNLLSACPRCSWILAVFWCREQELKAQYLKKLYRTATLWLLFFVICIPIIAIDRWAVVIFLPIGIRVANPNIASLFLHFCFLLHVFGYYLSHAPPFIEVSQAPIIGKIMKNNLYIQTFQLISLANAQYSRFSCIYFLKTWLVDNLFVI